VRAHKFDEVILFLDFVDDFLLVLRQRDAFSRNAMDYDLSRFFILESDHVSSSGVSHACHLHFLGCIRVLKGIPDLFVGDVGGEVSYKGIICSVALVVSCLRADPETLQFSFSITATYGQ
jgi:hypothetical protein